MNKKVIDKIKKGDSKSFRLLYEEYYEQSMRTAYSMLRDEADASDAVQETFIRVYRKIHSFDNSKPFKPWFYRILTNEVRRVISKRKDNKNIDETVHENNLTESEERKLEKTETIQIALKQLKDEHKEIVTLKYLDGFSEKEISDLLEITVSAVKSRLFQARQKLQVILGGYKDE